MPERFSEYTDKVLAKLKWKKVRPLVKEELEAHLAESSEELFLARNCEDGSEAASSKADGASFDDNSDDAAIAAMGSPEEAGSRLNGLYKPRVDMLLLVGVGLLMALALWIVPFGEWAIYALGVLAVGAAFAFFNVRNFLQKYALYIFIAGVLALMLVPTPLFSRMINGARRSLPIEFIGMFLCLCGMGAMLGDGRDVKRPASIAFILAMTACSCLPILVMPHFSMLVMFGFSIWAMYFRSKMPRAFVWALLGFGVLFVVFILLQAGYRLARIAATFIPPALDPNGVGYLPSLLMKTWGGARWIGSTAMEPSIADWFNYSYPLAYFAASAGKLPAYLAIALNALVIWRMFYLSRKLKDRISSIITFGVSILVALTGAFGILNSFGWLILDSHAMFINTSASQWLLQGACVSIVFALNLNRDYIRLSQGSKPEIEGVRRRLRIQFEWTK